MTLDESTAELAVSVARIAREQEDPQRFICEAGWCALALLHDLMASKKQMISIYEIGSDSKLKYWSLACVGRPEASKFKRICISKALYMYSIINSK